MLVMLSLSGCARRSAAPAVTLVPVRASSRFPEAIAEGALYHACAPDRETLESYLRTHNAPFEAALVKAEAGGFCHVFYQPTIPGFEAFPENAHVSEVFLNVDALALLTGRRDLIGDSLDLARKILCEVKRPLRATLGVGTSGHELLYERALVSRFGRAASRIVLHPVNTDVVDPWVQDFMKPGHVGSARVMLVSRRAFEGHPENGDAFAPMLESFLQPGFVRSKLSFEGGDLAFERDPGSGRLVLFYGNSAQTYFGESLTREEFEYVLRVEFGAEKALFAGGVTPHIDYELKQLLNHRVALLAEPVCGNLALARAAVQVLRRILSEPQRAQLANLTDLLFEDDDALARNRDRIVDAARRATADRNVWASHAGEASRGQIEDYVKLQCPANPAQCITGDNLSLLLEKHEELLKEWVRVGTEVNLQENLALRLLEVIRRQASGCDDNVREALDRQAALLEELGYRVVRVPWIQGDGAPNSPWPGVSYANCVDIDDTLFVPEIGLGKVEAEWLDGLARQLRGQYRVVPTLATRLLIDNGGVHCAVACVPPENAGE